MESLYGCAIAATVQVDAITRQMEADGKKQKKYHNLELQLPLDATEEYTCAMGNAYNVATLQAPLIAYIGGDFRGTPEPKITIHSLTQRYTAEDVPDNYQLPPAHLSGTGRVDNARHAFDLLAYLLPESRFKNLPDPPSNATVNFSGRLHSQQPTSQLFVIMIDTINFSTAGTTTNPTSGSNTSAGPASPAKKPRLGKRSSTAKGKGKGNADQDTGSSGGTTTA
ncbi:hypothetical protein OC835_002285 [Tilletia horrida]|nr:hypothetical protein OC835_002285 [Tilletia horrida]